MSKTILLGEEYDESLREALIGVLKAMGAVSLDSERNVVGSQELETYHFQLGGAALTVEAETYMGLSITGDEAQVDEIAGRLNHAR